MLLLPEATERFSHMLLLSHFFPAGSRNQNPHNSDEKCRTTETRQETGLTNKSFAGLYMILRQGRKPFNGTQLKLWEVKQKKLPSLCRRNLKKAYWKHSNLLSCGWLTNLKLLWRSLRESRVTSEVHQSCSFQTEWADGKHVIQEVYSEAVYVQGDLQLSFTVQGKVEQSDSQTNESTSILSQSIKRMKLQLIYF